MQIKTTVENLNLIFKTCKNFISKQGNGRPIYQTIQLKSIGNDICQASALDGYRAVTLTIEVTEADVGEMCIPVIKTPKDGIVIISDTGDEILFDFLTEKQIVRKIDGEFMDMEKAFPTQEPELSVGFNPKYLSDALSCFKDLVQLDFINDTQVVVMSDKTGKKAMVMPVRL